MVYMSYAPTKRGLKHLCNGFLLCRTSAYHMPIKSILLKKKKIRMNQDRRTVLRHVENLKVAKNIDPCQPAQSAQADMCRYFSHIQQAPFAQGMYPVLFFTVIVFKHYFFYLKKRPFFIENTINGLVF